MMTEGTIKATFEPLEPAWLMRLLPDRDSPLSLGRQLYLGLYQAIVDGELPAGERLPATRALAARLGVARNTVIAAYAQLGDEGLVSSAGRRGTRVTLAADATAQAVLTEAGRVVRRCVPDGLRPDDQDTSRGDAFASLALSVRSDRLVTGVLRHRALSAGEPDTSLFPAQQWQRALARAARLPPAELGYTSTVATRLQAGIARHLAVYRSLVVDPACIVITSGTRQSLALAAALYADAGASALVEAPGYSGVVDAFRSFDLQVQACPVDREGAIVPAGIPPRLIYLTPCFQFPLGMPLSVERREAFLALSAQHGSILIEDDYDSEFRDDRQPRPALAGGAKQHGALVLHAGTFSKLIFPAARVAWLVLPEAHVERAQAMLRALGGGHGTIMQAAVAELLDRGVVARHLHRARQVYAQRRVTLFELLGRSDTLDLTGGGGLSVLASFETAVSVASLEAAIDAAGLGAKPLERYHWESEVPAATRRLVMGLGNVDSLSLPGAIACLEQAIRSA